jgi:hypothetical protein
MIGDEEEFVLELWEQGEKILVNLSELPDEELRNLRDWIIEELKAKNITRHSEDERVQKT